MIKAQHVLAAAFAVGMIGTAHANIVQNPGLLPANPAIAPGYGAISGWTASNPSLAGTDTSTGVFWNNGAINDGLHGPTGTDGSVGFLQVQSAAPTNTLSQTLSLISGDTYSISFAYDARFIPGTAATIAASIGGTTLLPTTTVTSADQGDFSGSFQMFSGTFTAASTSELLSFTAGLAAGQTDDTLLLSDVSVVDTSVPEPASSLALLGLSLMVVGLVRGRSI
jgi:hypothetical protein